MYYGPEFIAKTVRGRACHYQTIYIKPGPPWENPYVESFIGILRRECLNRYLFGSGEEAQEILREWRRKYNKYRRHRSLGNLALVKFAKEAIRQVQNENVTLSL